VRDAVLIQHCWPPEVNAEYAEMLALQVKRNREYCDIHAFDYQPVVGNVKDEYASPNTGEWPKVELIRRALAEGYRYVIFLDPDTLIRDMDADLRDGCPEGLGACWHRIPQMNHWNTGALYMQKTPGVLDFVTDWLAMFPGERAWMEQGEFNKLAMQSRVVQTISDRWNATMNYTMVPDAVVLGFHGNGNPKQRLEMMRATLPQIEQSVPVLAEVTDGA
jgi:hypothetical protein